MLVSKIQEYLAAYKIWLTELRHHPHVYWWESVHHFQANWNPDDPDPADMYERCLQNSETRRLWQTEIWQPKRVMAAFWRFDPRMVKAMFEDLFNETREPENRIRRFIFGCDELLRDYKRTHPTSVENNHYHEDYRMIALYLAFRYPEQYAAPYDFPVFREALLRLGAREAPQNNDLLRFFKMQRSLMTFLEKDERLVAAMQQHLHPKRHYGGRALLLAADFTHFIARS